MRTALTIDDDVREAVKDWARREGRTAGEVLSDIARRQLSLISEEGEISMRNGFPVLGSRGTPVTNALIDRLRDEESL